MTIFPPAAFLGVGIGGSEVLLVLAVALILLGPRELPKAARALGRVVYRLQSASRDFRDQIMQIGDDSEPPAPGAGKEDSKNDPAG